MKGGDLRVNTRICVIVVVAIAFDVITGLLKGMAQHDLNSTALRKGLYHKVSEVLALVLAIGLEYVAAYVNLGLRVPFLTAVSCYITVAELVSILENLCVVNPGLRRVLGPWLEKLHEEVKTEDEPDD